MTSVPQRQLCIHCGNSYRAGAQFCPRCGSPDPAGTAAAAHAAPPPPAPPPGQPFPAAETFASQGQVRQNQTYVGNRLMYSRNGQVEASFLNVVTGRMVWAHLKSVLVIEAIIWFIAALVTIPLSIASSLNSLGGGGESGTASVLRVLFLFLAIGVLIVMFSGQVQEPMSEWELLLDERSVSADAAYAAMARALQRRAIPAQVFFQQIAKDTTTRTVGNYLVVRNDPYVVYVSVVPYGTGLYLSWSMWREQPVTRLYAEWFRQARNKRAGAGTLLHYMLRAEDARALRETVHNAVRDGVEAAIAGQRVNLKTAFGGHVPPVSSASASVPPTSSGALLPPMPPMPPMPPVPGANGRA